MIAGVVLAAGTSRRLGRPKQLVTIDGETLIRRAISTALSAGLQPVIAIVNSAELLEPLQALGAQVLLNSRHFEGMASSIHTGVQHAASAGASGVVILACDQPALTAPHLRELTAYPNETAGSAYANKIGIPAYFPAAMFANLLQLQGDTGARDLLRNARTVHAEDLSLDIDTEEDLALARKRFG